MVYLKKLLKQPLVYLLVLFLLSLNPLFKPGVWPSHDLKFHFARLGAFYLSLSEGNLIPRWAGNLYYGYGYPILMLYYPLANYLGSLFHAAGFSIVASVKLLFIVSFLLSGVFMFLWLKEWLGQKAALVGTALFQFAPYRFVNIYIRGTIGEPFGYIFMPLSFWLIYRLVKQPKPKRLALAALGLAGLFLSHNLIIFFTLPFLIIYSVYLLWGVKSDDRNQTIKYLTAALLLAAGLTLWFWLPLILEISKYTVFNEIVTGGNYNQYFLHFEQLIYSSWGYGGNGGPVEPASSSVMIGLGNWLSAMLGLGYLIGLMVKKRKNVRLIFLLFVLSGSFVGAVFLMLPLSAGLTQWFPLAFRLIQFPARFRTVAVLASALTGAILIKSLPGRLSGRLTTIVAAIAILSSIPAWRVKAMNPEPSDDYWLGVNSQEADVGESKPIWLWNKTAPAAEKIATASGKLTAMKINIWESQRHEYEFYAAVPSVAAENTAYFPGWKVYVDGVKTPIEFQNIDWPGLITYPLSPGQHQVKVEFGTTRVRLIAGLISLATLAGIVLIIGII